MSKTLLTRYVIIASVLVTLSLGSCKKNFDPTATDPTLASSTLTTSLTVNQDFVPNELIVKFKPGNSENAKNNALARIGGSVSEKILTKAMERAGDNEGIYLVHCSLNALDARDKIKGAEVEIAEPNYIYTHDAIVNDTYFTSSKLWGLDAAFTNGSCASTAWGNGHTGLASVTVGVIDEGIQFDHPDLAGQIWTNPYDPVDGIDNDGNGYIDDIHGWDFDGNNNTIYDGGKAGKSDQHGTHVAGTIGAKANNGIGVVGMNWYITIISAKFLGSRGGTTANAIKAVDYITDLKTRHIGMNIVATNNSWGGGGSSSLLAAAIERANTANILFIAAAGNGNSAGIGQNNDAVASYPSNYTNANVIAVAAIDYTGKLASFSNYGATTVDLGAPGVGIWSTVAYNSYASYNGTSMATPHVTGAAALWASTHTGATAADIKTAILGSVIPTSSLSGKTATGGRLNVSGF